MTNSTKPPSSYRIRLTSYKQLLKQVTVILGIIFSIITATLAHFKTEKEVVARSTYEEFSTAIQELSKNQVALQKDMARLSGYLEGQRSATVSLAKRVEKDQEENIETKRRYARYPKPPPPPPEENHEMTNIIEQASAAPPKPKANPKLYEPPKLEELINKPEEK